jgi:hypothetical protein
VFDVLTYNWIKYNELRYHDLYNKQPEKNNKGEEKEVKEIGISGNLLKQVILPIRDWVTKIDTNVKCLLNKNYLNLILKVILLFLINDWLTLIQ